MSADGRRVVLVADDDAVGRRLARWQLERLGFAVVAVESGEAAVAATEGQDFAAILMDCRMPGLDGYEATRAIRRGERNHRVPILAITADPAPEAAQAAGMTGVLVKPVDMRTLEAALVEALGAVPRPAADRAATFAKDVRSLFRADAPARLAALRTAVDSGDAAAVLHTAHTLVGTAGQAQLTAVAALAGELEGLAKSGTLSARARDLLERLEAAVAGLA